ncbi:hypothetical protein [Pseudorhizobium flavum]|uniref:hypothetical protein n=1 Tax=Pseudorhizobium flavum TaxID=1335061 RepID=UPI002490997F|nr:hypothetical protein [Pseudorhizobium flavum]
MQYDWSGVRTRRIARAKMAAYAMIAIVVVSAPVFVLAENSPLSVAWLIAPQ